MDMGTFSDSASQQITYYRIRNSVANKYTPTVPGLSPTETITSVSESIFDTPINKTFVFSTSEGKIIHILPSSNINNAYHKTYNWGQRIDQLEKTND